MHKHKAVNIFLGTIFGVILLSLAAYAQTPAPPANPVLAAAEAQRGHLYTSTLAQAQADVDARTKDLAAAQSKKSADLKPNEIAEIKARQAAAAARAAQANSQLRAWETQLLSDHHADANFYKIDWNKNLIVKR